MPTITHDADEIRRQMASIRRELHQDVRDVVTTAEHVADWTRYIGKYPWISLGLACGIGYLIVPAKKSRITSGELAAFAEASTIKDAVNNAKSSPGNGLPKGQSKANKGFGLVGAAFGLLAPLAVRAAQGYALKYLENWIAQQTMAQAGPQAQTIYAPDENRPRRTNP